MGQSNEKKRDFFWLSYSDLMTSLFFVMLVLFILVYSMQNKLISDLENNNQTLTAAKEELERIKEVEKIVNNIDKNYFRYDSINKKHILNMTFQFPTNNAEIMKLDPAIRIDFFKAGKSILTMIDALKKDTTIQGEKIKFFIVVEGQASNDGWNGNDDLSYHRAQSLVKFWKENNVGLDTLKNCEIVIAGSGVKGTPRDEPDIPPANQRFLITIVPKIGKMRK
jgi:Na+-transporting methylmalonyl-CoA/oxaloacetate decarboxylase gamma subunit